METSNDEFFDLPGLEADDTINEEIIAKEESQRKDELIRQTPVIQSIHASCRLGRMIDPKQVTRRIWNAVYDPRRSQNGVQVVLRKPRTSTTVFQSGKVICLGAKSEASALIACRKVARLIQRLPNYSTIQFFGFKVNNVTASGALGFRVDLNALARHPAHEPYAHYDPDHFPGLHYKLPFSLFDEEFKQKQIKVKAEASAALATQKANGITAMIDLTSPYIHHEENVPMTLTLYFSGKFTLVGAQSERQVFLAFSWLSRALWPFAVQSSLAPSAPKDNFDAWLAWAENEERRCTPMPPWEDEERNVVTYLTKREAKRASAQAQLSADVKMTPSETASAIVKQENSAAHLQPLQQAVIEPMVQAPSPSAPVPSIANGQAPMAIDQPAAPAAAAAAPPADETGEDVDWE